MREIIVYSIVALSSLIVTSYTVHMFIGGLVSERTEKIAMVTASSIIAIIIGLMARDVIKRRKAAANQSINNGQGED